MATDPDRSADYGAIRCAIYNVAGMLDAYLPLGYADDGTARPQVPQKAAHRPLGTQVAGHPQRSRPSSGYRSTAAANGAPGPGVDWLPVEARWWRHWLLGESNGIMEEARVWALREDAPRRRELSA